jgi:hypothetical protein
MKTTARRRSSSSNNGANCASPREDDHAVELELVERVAKLFKRTVHIGKRETSEPTEPAGIRLD